MNCRKAERWILASFDRDLSPASGRDLSEHLDRCPECGKCSEEYRLLRGRLAGGPVPELVPRFWERLESRITEGMSAPAPAWSRLWVEAIPISLSLIAGFVLASLFLLPAAPDSPDLTGAQALALTEGNPIAEIQVIIDEESRDVRDLTLLFTGNEPSDVRK